MATLKTANTSTCRAVSSASRIPVCVYEADGMREDIDMHEALRLIRVRSLKPARHPVWGESSC